MALCPLTVPPLTVMVPPLMSIAFPLVLLLDTIQLSFIVISLSLLACITIQLTSSELISTSVRVNAPDVVLSPIKIPLLVLPS